VTFDQGSDLAVVAAGQKTTFPVTGHGTILGLSRSFADTDRIEFDPSRRSPSECHKSESTFNPNFDPDQV